MVASPLEIQILLAFLMFLGAMLYTSVGHAGASAYLALMALFGMSPQVMKPTALVLNILVAIIASFRYVRAGLFDWRTLWPFLIGAIPLGFVGGAIQLPTQTYRLVVGVVLFIAAARLLWPTTGAPKQATKPPVVAGVASGAGIGLVSGLTGTGGGIFLSPLLLFMGWSETKVTSGVAAVFILVISTSGLLGNLSSVKSLPPNLWIFACAVLAGAAIGTTLGIKRLAPEGVLKALGLVLIVAGLKLVGFY
jgi:hypothetical protein